jgi:hypothetical protein
MYPYKSLDSDRFREGRARQEFSPGDNRLRGSLLYAFTI